LELLPAEIAKYTKANFADRPILKVEKTKRGYELELGGDIELEFDLAGKFLKMD
jgi:hypothetical protein